MSLTVTNIQSRPIRIEPFLGGASVGQPSCRAARQTERERERAETKFVVFMIILR